jgi:hypothetical protein
MGQRYTIDAEVFQNLVHRAVPGRMLPKSLDIPAAFGSDAALGLLSDEVSMYSDYSAQMEKMRGYTAGIPGTKWTSNLYWSWMYMLMPLADEPNGAGYPKFMQNEAWTLKELNTFQGSWTELKYDTILYAKAMLAEAGGGDEAPAAPDDRGYVEPNPDVYGRLAALVMQTRSGLTDRGLLTSAADEALTVLYQLSDRLRLISELELSGSPLSEDDYEFIRGYGYELEHIWDTAKHYELSTMTDEYTGEMFGEQYAEWLTPEYLRAHPCGVIADVATNPNGQVLEEATGFAKVILVVFPRNGKLALGSGLVYSQYEFTVPLDKRVTSEEWHVRMNNGALPPLADWKSKFTADIGETGYFNLSEFH